MLGFYGIILRKRMKEKEENQKTERIVEMVDKITKTVDDEVAKKDLNGDGHISQEEMEMDLEFKRKELEDADARRDAMRKMTWFSLLGMLLYPFAVVIANLIGLEQAGKILGDIAPTYFVSVANIVMGFFGANAYSDKKKNNV